MSGLKMTEAHVRVLEIHYDQRGFPVTLYREILSVIKGLADGSLRCADSTEEIVKGDAISATMLRLRHLANGNASGRIDNVRAAEVAEDIRDVLAGWLSTRDLPAAPSPETTGSQP